MNFHDIVLDTHAVLLSGCSLSAWGTGVHRGSAGPDWCGTRRDFVL